MISWLLACALPAPVPAVGVDGTTFTATQLTSLRARVAEDPPTLSGDPYAEPRARELLATPIAPAAACAVVWEADDVHYRLQTFANEADALAVGATVTHDGACGTCSTLADLAVYLERRDLTTPVRACAMAGGLAHTVACLERLGFTQACAETWAYNAENTRRKCLGSCLLNLGAPSNLPDGELNACLQCDEDRSGPIFQRVAGRTRRNSGLISSIARPGEQVRPVAHHELDP